MARKKSRKKLSAGSVVFAFIFFVIAVIGYYVYKNYFQKQETPPPVVIDGELSFHFLQLGNDHSGDCIYVKAGDNDILIDAGSETNSVTTIRNYLNTYCTDNILEYVIVTHGDSDHISGFAGTTSENTSIFDYYECKVIIDFPKTEKTTATYGRYVNKRDAEVSAGAKHYTALECYLESVEGAKKSYTLGDGISLNILYNYYYENDSSKENNYSVCVMFTHGDRNFLFTGDLELSGEEKLVELNQLPEVELYKAGHHGSKTSSNDVLLSTIKPKIVAITCVAAEPSYGDGYGFPHQQVIDNISKYTDKVYVTSTCVPDYTNGADVVGLNGDIVVTSGKSGVTVDCSVSDLPLKDSKFMKDGYRLMPVLWQSA